VFLRVFCIIVSKLGRRKGIVGLEELTQPSERSSCGERYKTKNQALERTRKALQYCKHVSICGASAVRINDLALDASYTE
jgi:hypothetical protein